MAHILAFSKDAGGTEGVLPVVKELRRRGHIVTYGASGIALGMLADRGEYVIPVDSGESLLRLAPSATLLVTSMCSRGGAGREAIPLCRAQGLRTVALSDTWGWKNEFSDAQFWPDVVVVNDDVGAEIVRTQIAFSEARTKVVVCGFPAIDRFAHVDSATLGTEARLRMGIGANAYVCLFQGQGRGAGVIHDEVVDALLALDCVSPELYYIPRPHLRMASDYPAEMRGWQLALERVRHSAWRVVEDTKNLSTESLIAMSSSVLSVFSTVLMEAAILRRDCVSIMMPTTGLTYYRESTGYDGEYPLVALGCVRKVASPLELRMALIESVHTGIVGQTEAQEQQFDVSGNNAAKVAALIESVLKK